MLPLGVMGSAEDSETRPTPRNTRGVSAGNQAASTSFSVATALAMMSARQATSSLPVLYAA